MQMPSFMMLAGGSVKQPNLNIHLIADNRESAISESEKIGKTLNVAGYVTFSVFQVADCESGAEKLVHGFRTQSSEAMILPFPAFRKPA